MQFTRSEIHPDQLPLIETRIRQAQNNALSGIGLSFPSETEQWEQRVDAANKLHRDLIRSGVNAPRLTSGKPVKTFSAATWWLLTLIVAVGTIALKVNASGNYDGSRWNPWAVAAVLAVPTVLVLLPAFIGSFKRQKEMQWAQMHQFNTQQITIAQSRLQQGFWVALTTAIWTAIFLWAYYNTDLIQEAHPQAFIIASAVPVLYTLIVLTLWQWAKADWKRARQAVEATGQSDPFNDFDLRDRVTTYDRINARHLMWRTRDFQPSAYRALEDATTKVLNELLADYAITPDIHQRMANADWSQVRLLTTTPEYADGAAPQHAYQLTNRAPL